MDANTKLTQMSELPNKDFKAAIIKTLPQAIMNLLETGKKKIECLHKEIEGKKATWKI